MNLKHTKKALILGAGFGTRMGEIGNFLPKILWPVFEKRLIELQVAYAHSMGVEKIFINLHHQALEIKTFIEKSKFLKNYDIIILEETPNILGSGGAVHNLKTVDEFHGNILLLNADQFLFFDNHFLTSAEKLLDKNIAALFTSLVPRDGGYSTIKISPTSHLVEIIGSTEISTPGPDFLPTYSGMGLVNLDKLTHVPGASNFFETVAPYETGSVYMVKLDRYEYWDFGTLERYLESSFKVLGTQRSEFLSFLEKYHGIDVQKISSKHISYNCSSTHIINLNDFPPKKSPQKTVHFGDWVIGQDSV